MPTSHKLVLHAVAQAPPIMGIHTLMAIHIAKESLVVAPAVVKISHVKKHWARKSHAKKHWARKNLAKKHWARKSHAKKH